MDVFKVDKWRARLSRLVIASRCLLCGERGANGVDLCVNCHAELPWNRSACDRCGIPLATAGTCGDCLLSPPPTTATRAAFVYGFPLDRLVPRFKFHGDLAAGRVMAELMLRDLVGADRPDAVLPVPLHDSRLRQRGYDQALELARPLAHRLGLPLRTDLLQRIRATSPQSELDAAARQRNLRNAFNVPATAALPAHVALVDDVMTTGATLHAAANALLRAGVSRVDAWVCARVP